MIKGQVYPGVGVTRFEDDVPWRAWTPEQIRDRLDTIRTPAGHPVRWAVAGGWALDLFLGRVTREHEDVEIVVLNDDVATVLDAFRQPEWSWRVPTDGWLNPLDSAAFTETHQSWLWSQPDDAFVLDVFRDEHDGQTWICRRDPRIRLLWPDVAHQNAGSPPYLVPEVVLLFKAKHSRPKDLQDLETVLPFLSRAQRTWLREALNQVHPGHEWLTLI